MPFYIYDCTPKGKTEICFDYRSPVTLAGHGLIPSAMRQRQGSYRITAKQLLGERDGNSRIISDVTPDRKNESNLMSIEAVSCFAYDTWMPLLFHMVQVMHEESNDEEKKKSFVYNKKQDEWIRSFVYLRKDDNDTWQWGRTGGVNGPLLWPDAMNFFHDEIKNIGFKARLIT